MNETRARDLLLAAADTIDVAPSGPLDTTGVRRPPRFAALVAAAAAVVIALGVTAYVVRDDRSAAPGPSEVATDRPESTVADQFAAFVKGPDSGTTSLFADEVVVVLDNGDRVTWSGEYASLRGNWISPCANSFDCAKSDLMDHDLLDFIGDGRPSPPLDCGAPGAAVGPGSAGGDGRTVYLQSTCDFEVVLGLTRDDRVASVRLSDLTQAAEVPEVRGLYRKEAIAAMREAGFDTTVRTVDTEQCYDDGLVLEQDPQAGTRLAGGSTVTIRVNQETETPAFCGGDPLAPPD